MPDDGPDDRPYRRKRPTHWEHPVDEDRRKERARSHRRRRLAIAAFVLLALGLTAAYLYLTSDSRVKKFAETYLQEQLGTRVSISRASFSWTEGLVLEDLRVMPPPPFKDPLLVAKRLDLRLRPLSLLRLRPEVTEIVVHQPEVTLILWDEKTWNFQALLQNRPQPLQGEVTQHPVVVLKEGTLTIQRKVAGVTVYEHKMKASGLLQPDELNPDAFRFQTDVKSETVSLAVASGQLDARTGALSFEGQASNIALTPDLHAALPREAQRLWDRFEPTGSINLKILFDEKQGFRLVADLTGVSFSAIYNTRVYTFENLTGRCAFSSTGLVLAGIQGLANKTPVRLEGRLIGFETDRLGMDLSVQADHVDFQQNQDAFVNLAPAAANLYEWYSPKGQIDVALKVHRDVGKDLPITISGSGYCRDIEVTFSAFPYRLERLHGTIDFGPDGYKMVNMEARHGQAVIQLDGWAKNLGTPLMESLVHVRSPRVPLDEDLRAALGPKERATYDQFAPSGTAGIEAKAYRPPRADALTEVTIHLNLLDGRFKYVNFPYQLTETTGRISIFPDHTEIAGVRGRHGAGAVTLDGLVTWSGDSPPEVSLKVGGQDIPLDEDLEAALQPQQREIMRVYHLAGLADIAGTVVAGAKTQYLPDYDLTVNLKQAQMTYEGFPYLVDQMTGRLRLEHGSCRIDSISGYHRGARIEAAGWIDQRPDDYAMDITLHGKDVALDEALRGALGPEVRKAWSHLAARGAVDITAHLAKTLGPQEPMQHQVRVVARDAQACLDFFPYPLEHVSGTLDFEGSRVVIQNLKASGGSAEFGLDGTILYGPQGPEVDMVLRSKGLRLEGPLRDALPAPLQRAFGIVHPTGRVDLDGVHIAFRPTGPNASEATWSGSALLDEVGLEIGVVAGGLVGTAEMTGRWADDRVELKTDLHIQQGRVSDKALSDAHLVIEKPADSSDVVVRSVEGAFYGGRVEGSATIHLDPTVSYALNLAATDVDFTRLLKEGFRIEQDVSGGRLKATLGLRAQGPEASNVEASGYADVTDARLYELPLAVRVFNALRLAPGDRTAFTQARVLYFVRGKRIILGDIRLDGPAVSLYGAGIVDADGQLNLTFLAGKRDEDPLIPALSELLEGVRKELVIVQVTGTLAEPKVEMRTLSGLTAPFRELISLVREQRSREAPRRR
jgi:hypothetical protein